MSNGWSPFGCSANAAQLLVLIAGKSKMLWELFLKSLALDHRETCDEQWRSYAEQ